MTDNYEDIIGMEHPTSVRHHHMSMSERAAQFAPFAALSGYDAMLEEQIRNTIESYDLIEESQ